MYAYQRARVKSHICFQAEGGPCFIYHKSGLFLTDIVSDTEKQQHLILRPDEARNVRLMNAVNRINRKHGRHTVRPLSVGFDHNWEMKQARLSPRYTARVNEVLKVMAK